MNEHRSVFNLKITRVRVSKAREEHFHNERKAKEAPTSSQGSYIVHCSRVQKHTSNIYKVTSKFHHIN